MGEEVWTTPGRGARPITNRPRHDVKQLEPGTLHDDDCAFCPANIIHTPAEKSRLLADGTLVQNPSPSRTREGDAFFRRVPNLYEIVPWEFWKKVYGLTLNAGQAAHRDTWLADPVGLEHLRTVVAEKLKYLGEWVDPASMDVSKISEMAEQFFGGSHDLVVSGQHFRHEAASSDDVLSSGDLTAAEHLVFVDYSFQSAEAIKKDNPKVAWVSVFQNWRSPAGASFNHLHKQVLGLDVLPPGVTRRQGLEQVSPGFFNREILGLVKKEKLALLENDRAIAVVEPGHGFPTIMIYSKHPGRSWGDLDQASKRDLSSLLRACHACMDGGLPLNEEWLYAGADGPAFPVHVALKWRLATPAGLEGGARVLLCPLDPFSTRDRALEGLKGINVKARLGGECDCEPGCLEYEGA